MTVPKRLVVVPFLLVAALLATGCDQMEKLIHTGPTASSAKIRLQFVLQTIKDHGQGTSTELQTAICRWDRDKVLINDRDELGLASDAFDAWRQKADIYPTLESFEVGDPVEEHHDGDPEGTFYLQTTINGNHRVVRVPPNARISWVETSS